LIGSLFQPQDFTQSTEQLGKPQGQDLASGNLTAPAIFALRADAEGDFRALIESEFTEEHSLQRAIGLVDQLGGIQAARGEWHLLTLWNLLIRFPTLSRPSM
jgi:geranylgeranyl pyrophosphate synthase